MFQAGAGGGDYTDLMSLVQAQQTRLQSQQAEIKHVSYDCYDECSDCYEILFQCDNELKCWDGVGPGRPTPAPASFNDVIPNQLEAVMSEVRRLEETANKNEEELSVILETDRASAGGGGIRGELDQLKHRLGKIVLLFLIRLVEN